MLAKEAKRFPKVAALLERVHTLTDEEIEAADVPLKWYKKALRKLRDQMKDKLATQQAFEAKMLEVLSYVVDGFVNDPQGDAYEWIAGSHWMDIGKTSILMEDGKTIWIPSSGGVWIETLFHHTISKEWLGKIKPLGSMSKSRYTEYYKDAAATRLGMPLYKWEDNKPEARTIYRLDGRTDGINVKS